jgi:hypothetical protein
MITNRKLQGTGLSGNGIPVLARVLLFLVRNRTSSGNGQLYMTKCHI